MLWLSGSSLVDGTPTADAAKRRALPQVLGGIHPAVILVRQPVSRHGGINPALHKTADQSTASERISKNSGGCRCHCQISDQWLRAAAGSVGSMLDNVVVGDEHEDSQKERQPDVLSDRLRARGAACPDFFQNQNVNRPPSHDGNGQKFTTASWALMRERNQISQSLPLGGEGFAGDDIPIVPEILLG